MPSRARRKRKATEAAVADVLQPPASSSSRPPVLDEVDDTGNVTFISLSQYGALEDDDEVASALREAHRDRVLAHQRRTEQRSRADESLETATSASPKPPKRVKAGKDTAVKAASQAERQKTRSASQAAAPPLLTVPPASTSPPDFPQEEQDAADPSVPAPSTGPVAPLLSRFDCSERKLKRLSDGSYSLTLHAGEFLTFHGSVDLRVLYGYVDISAAELSPSSSHFPHQLHSPAWDPTALLCIRHHHRATLAHSEESTILLAPSSSPHALRSPPDLAAAELSIHIAGFHPLLQQTPEAFARAPYAPLTVPPAWADALTALSPPVASDGAASFLLCGPRNAGKSMLSRLLVNALMNHHRRVLYLDADVGQSEHTPPGFVSLSLLTAPLLSPPYTRLRTPVLAYFIGDTSFQGEPAAYMQAIAALVARVDAERSRGSERLPLVVNTAGWLTGVGGTILRELAALVRPQHVLFLGDEDGKDVPPRLPPSSKLRRLPRGPAPTTAVPSAEKLRTLALLSYLLGRTAPPISFLTASAHLSAAVPYRLPLSSITLTLLPGLIPPPPHLLPALFNLSFVSLHPAPSPSPSLGLALVRAVDAAALYLLTPLSSAVLGTVTHVVRGVGPEVPGAFVHLPGESLGQPYMPVHALAGGGGGGSVRGRKNLARKRLQ